MSASLVLLIAVFLLLILAGMPIAWAMLSASVSWIIFTGNYHFLQVIPQRLFEGIDVFVLLAIPLFVLTGEIINAGKVTDRLINMADVCFGRLRGGLPQAASRRRDIDRSFPAVMQATRSAAVPLMIPLVIVVCIISGIATPTEAGAIAVCYTLLITLLLYRTLRLNSLPGIFSRAMVFSSQLMILVGCGAILSWIMAVEHVPDLLNSFLVSMNMSAITSLVFLNVFLLIAGMFIDTAAAIILFSPLLLAAATNVGIHPLHFSVIMILNLNIGLLTPPLGICLLTAESIADCDLPALIKALAPLLLVNITALLIITYIPEISLLLPRYLGF